jgi:glyoxylase-like metal-dependent hydrolase (beta-lactamase superfamily II)
VIFSHHHPDHTLNAALFPHARFHDHWAIYQGDGWESRRAEGYEVSPSIRLIETPGHSPQDITTLVGTPEGVVAFTHLWWFASGPADDPFATDVAALHRNRERVLHVATLIVPGHGAPFTPGESTPR